MVQATITTNVGNAIGLSRRCSTSPAPICRPWPRPPTVRATSRSILDYSGSMRFASLTGRRRTSGNSHVEQPGHACIPTFGHYSATARRPCRPRRSPRPTTRPTSRPRPATAARRSSRTSTPTRAARAAFTAGLERLRHDARRRQLPEAEQEHERHVRRDRGPDLLNIAAPTNSTPKTRRSRARRLRYASLRHGHALQRLHAGPGLLGQDVLHLAARSAVDQRDWRKLYFQYPSSATPMDDNSQAVETSTGNWQAPSSTTYTINYTAILNFIKNVGPNPFPVAAAIGSHSVLRRDSQQHQHRHVPADRSERAVLEGLHRLRAWAWCRPASSSWTDHQRRHTRADRLRRRLHLGHASRSRPTAA